MYKVMLVDDDYPVLEYMADAVDWEAMGLQLVGMHENGASALEAAQRNMPDIVITDIGMPRMDGIELLRRLKERKPELRAAILSCHSEFHYAKQALKLHIQDYLVKDTLDLAEIKALLQQFSASLQAEAELQKRQQAMRLSADRSITVVKERFIRAAIHEPMLDSAKWLEELGSFGLHWRPGEHMIAAIAAVDHYRSAQQRFLTDDMLRFALDNALEEALRSNGSAAVHFVYSQQQFVLLQAFAPGLKVNGYEELTRLLSSVQSMLQRSVKLTFSYMLGERCESPSALKASLSGMLADSAQWFYRAPRAALRRGANRAAAQFDLYNAFGAVGERLQEQLLRCDKEQAGPVIEQWAAIAAESRFPPQLVKDWALRLLLDAKQKLQSRQHYRIAQSLEAIHQEIYTIATLTELTEWFLQKFQSVIGAAAAGAGRSKRAEIVEAYHYVSRSLDKKISLEEVAEALYMNPSYFSRLFKKETGETFIEYVTRMKMQRAMELLSSTGAPIGKICETLGYDNPSYFIKLFKSYAGMTPAEYRGQRKQG